MKERDRKAEHLTRLKRFCRSEIPVKKSIQLKGRFLNRLRLSFAISSSQTQCSINISPRFAQNDIRLWLWIGARAISVLMVVISCLLVTSG